MQTSNTAQADTLYSPRTFQNCRTHNPSSGQTLPPPCNPYNCSQTSRSSVQEVQMENQWTIPLTDPQRRHVLHHYACRIFKCSFHSPGPTYRRTPRACFPTKRTYGPTGQKSYHPELLLCAVFCWAAHSSRTTDLVPR